MRSLCAYLAPAAFVSELKAELQAIYAVHENLILAEGPRQKSVWAQCIAEDVQIQNFSSIGEAVKILRAAGKSWALQPIASHRRADLIQDQLPKYKIKALDFLAPPPHYPMGLWALLDEKTLLYSAKTSSPFPRGEIIFNEDKSTPPSRAYLKLWELFTVHSVTPVAGERVIDFGSCPGGWTWVLQQLGCEVISIDKAPLDAKIQALPRVHFIKTDAFAMKPEKLIQEFGSIDWFFSDIICYPPKLFELVRDWIDKGFCARFVCTIKFQGETDFETMKRFEEDLGAKVLHLYHNKHEVTAIIDTSSSRPR